MSVVASAVDTVVVCFAESPNEFQTNYPHLSEQMVQAWRRTYPQEFICPRGAPALHHDTGDYLSPVGHAQELQPAVNIADPLAPQTSFT
jgi:predicted HD phosphohydrolase